MTENSGSIEYGEVREYALLERVLRDRRISLPVVVMLTASILCIALALFHIFVAGFGTPESHSFRSTHVSVMLVLAIMFKPLFRRSMTDPLLATDGAGNAKRILGFIIDLALIALVISAESYLLFDVEEFQAREGDPTEWDVYMGAILVFLVLEATRRAVGWTMVIVTSFFILQTLYSDYFFSFFYGPPTSFARFIDIQFIRTEGAKEGCPKTSSN